MSRCALNCHNCMSKNACTTLSADDARAYMVECAVTAVVKHDRFSSAGGMFPRDFFAEESEHEFCSNNGFIIEGGCGKVCPHFENRCENDTCCGCRLPSFGQCLIMTQLFEETGVEVGDRGQNDTEITQMFVTFGEGRRVFIAFHDEPQDVHEFVAT